MKRKRAARGARRQERVAARVDRRADRAANRDADRVAARGVDGGARREVRPGRGERRRRSPEVARQELLDASERVFMEFTPDQVGLKEVAREAGVSHALITHYFGTYAGLIEATLQRRLIALRETMVSRIGDATVLSRPEELIEILFRTFEDPVHLRLMKWLVATERPAAMHALALQQHGLQIVAHQVAGALHGGGSHPPPRKLIEAVELALMTAVAAALGYAMAKYALAGAAGKSVGNALDKAVQSTLAGMVQGYLASQGGVTAPAAKP